MTIPARTWPSSIPARCAGQLQVLDTDPDDDLVVLTITGPVINGDDVLTVELDPAATGELVTDLLRRLAAIAGRRVATQAAAQGSIMVLSQPLDPRRRDGHRAAVSAAEPPAGTDTPGR